MGELEDRISSVLNDPAQMEQILGMAQSLMGGAPEPSPEKEAAASGLFGKLANLFPGEGDETPGLDPALLSRLGQALREDGGHGRQQALLEAMKPYLSEKRRGKMDRAMKLARVSRVARLFLGQAGGEGDV